jgi:hypothetical protein
MQRAAVIPYDQIAFLPLVAITEVRLTSPLEQSREQGSALSQWHSDNAIGSLTDEK